MVNQDPVTPRIMKYPHWEREFEAAIAEEDPQTLRQRVDAAVDTAKLYEEELVRQENSGALVLLLENKSNRGETVQACRVSTFDSLAVATSFGGGHGTPNRDVMT